MWGNVGGKGIVKFVGVINLINAASRTGYGMAYFDIVLKKNLVKLVWEQSGHKALLNGELIH